MGVTPGPAGGTPNKEQEVRDATAWPVPPGSDWLTADHSTPSPSTDLRYQMTPLDVAVQQNLASSEKQISFLRSIAFTVMRAVNVLCTEREASAQTTPNYEQQTKHVTAFRNIFFEGKLLTSLCEYGISIGVDISKVDSAVREFSSHYETGPWRDGSTALSRELINRACSIIQSVLSPTISAQGKTLLAHVAQGLETLPQFARSDALEVGMQLGWSYLVSDPESLRGPAIKQMRAILVNPELLHRLVYMPLADSLGQVRDEDAFKRFTKLVESSPIKATSDQPTHEDLKKFAEIFSYAALTNPFSEGSKRVAWLVANDWLMKVHGHYIPWNINLENGFREIYQAPSSPWYVPGFVESILIRRHQQGIPERFARMLALDARSVRDL